MALVWSDSTDSLDWVALADLYLYAPLGKRDPIALKTAFSNSMFKCFIYDDGQLVGAGRALADGVDCSYICDVALRPSHQSMGLGTKIVTDLLQRSNGHKKIILYSVRGKETFYHKLGFRRMTTAMAIFDNQDEALSQGYVAED